MAQTKEQRAIWYKANKEKVKKYRQDNKEKLLAYGKSYKEMAKMWHLKRKYNITLEQHKQMIEDQGNCCAICDEVMTKPCVDHNHDTGAVRELLCDPCNKALGLFREDTRILEKAVMYIRFHDEGKIN